MTQPPALHLPERGAKELEPGLIRWFFFLTYWGCIWASCLQIAYSQHENKKPANLLNSRLSFTSLVGRVGLEPTTKGL